MVFRRLWLLPTAAVVCALIGMFSGYIIGTATNHYPPIIPFISDGGAFAPEAAVFAQFLNFAGFLFIITIYIRYRQTVEFYGNYLMWKKTRWWYASVLLMYIGYIAALGLTMVANFRENEIGVMHNISARLTFLTMVIYGWGQVAISYALVPRIIPTVINHFRLFVMIAATFFLVIYILGTSTRAFVPRNAGTFPGYDYFHHIKKGSPFYYSFIIATSAEWAMTFAMFVFILSLTAELRLSYLCAPRVVFKQLGDDANSKRSTAVVSLDQSVTTP